MKHYLKNTCIIVLSAGLMIIMQSCPAPKTFPPTVTTSNVIDLTQTTAVSGGNVTNNGGEDVTERGVCWGTTHNPTISVSKTSDGTGIGTFTSNIISLTPGTSYNVRAYATNSEGTGYGNEISFTTSPVVLATLTTTAISSITSTTAVSGGNITDDGGGTITARGVCWDTISNPTTANHITSDGTGTGSYTSNLTNLQPGTTYYVKAYATNSGGTVYANNELHFSTVCHAPSATTNAATNIGSTTATFNGTVNANGSSTTVTFEYGAITSYGNTVMATLSPVTGSSNTSVSADISGLNPNTTYHYRVKTVSCGGTIYGDDKTFATLCTKPTATTLGSSNVDLSAADITGIVNGNDFSTTVTFEYGTSTFYGYTISATPSAVTGSTITQVYANITGLTPGTTYHYKVDAVNCGGTISGNDQTFTTSCNPPIAITNAATNIGSSTATLNGAVYTNSFSTSVTFEYGTTIGYGSTMSFTSAGDGPISTVISMLTSNTTYHYTVIAENCGGTANGGDETFTTSNLVGTIYQGGIVAYVLQAGDPGFIAGQIHGLIAAPTDQSTGINWYNGSSTTDATGTALGTGMVNTNTIVSNQGAGSYAAELCNDLVLNGYSDWYLPSKDELNKLYINRAAIGGFSSTTYWSSTEYNSNYAWYQSFNLGGQGYYNKSNPYSVRAIRAF